MAFKAHLARLLARPVLPFLVAALFVPAFLTLPLAPKDIGTDGDVSLGAVLSYAHQHKLQFGPELVLTYGPLGFLIQGYYSEHAAGLRLLTDLAVCYAAAAGLCLAGWRLRLGWRLLLLGLFVFAASNLEGTSDLVLEVAFFCWGLLCFVESGRRLEVCIWTFAALAAFAALAKNSFLFMGALCVALITADLLLRERRRLALGLAGGFAAAFLVGWIAAGQHVLNLGVFLRNALAVVRAYNLSLGWEGLSATGHSGFVLAFLTLALVALTTLTAFDPGTKFYWWRRALLFAWAFGLTFSVWKHSFLREDFRHPTFLMGFAPVLVLGLTSLPFGGRPDCSAGRDECAGEGAGQKAATPATCRRVRLLAQGLALVCCLFALAVLQWLYMPSPMHSLRTPFRTWISSLHSLVKPGSYRRLMSEATGACRQEVQLPQVRAAVGDATADCFGFRQVYLLHNNLNYRPAPVFQSYVACDIYLMNLNERFYLSDAAPRFVLFSLDAVDRRFPPLEDAQVLRTLLFNYEPVVEEQGFLLLKAKTRDSPRLTLLCEGTIRRGQPIDLRPYGDRDLWLEIDVRPSWGGQVRQFLHRAPTVRLAAYREPGRALLLRRRAPPPMLAAGFLASPLLATTTDVLNLYKNTAITRPGAYSVESAPGTDLYWQPNIRFRIFGIENELGRCLPPDWPQQ